MRISETLEAMAVVEIAFMPITILLSAVYSLLGMIIGLMLGVIAFALLSMTAGKRILKSHRARIADPTKHSELYDVLEEVAKKADVRMPSLALVPTGVPNSFTVSIGGNTVVLALTYGALRTLNREEIKALMGHEIGHVINGNVLPRTVASFLSGILMSIPMKAGKTKGFFFKLFSKPAEMILKLAFNQDDEFAADYHALHLVGKNQLISALQKIDRAIELRPLKDITPSLAPLYFVNPFRGRGWAALFSLHPPTEERIRYIKEAWGETNEGSGS